ncbi:MAG: glycoside hydrolase family 9 protein [Lachnospiraceae bacterium]|nr:glycoside hydrolase family 9 protein [Lachnospiraceae bacterium]
MRKKRVFIIIAVAVLVLGGVTGFIISRTMKKNGGTDLAQTNTNQTTSEGNDLENSNSNQENSESASGLVTYGSKNHTVVGTETGSGYEGIKGTGEYNYGEALQKSLIFYELQRSGELPEVVRCNWRSDSCLNDGSDVGVDLTGGWYDAGDHVKFNLPMSYTASMLGWSLYEDYDAYEESGQLGYALANLRWANDYFIKCHPEDEVYYYQVGNGSSDHSWWGPVEVLELQMERPSYCVTADAPGSAVTAETAASLAICSIVFKDTDSAYSEECLKHAESLYAFADKYKSDAGYTAADGFYNSWSGYYDELAWAGAWLYLATNNKEYLTKAESYYPQAGQDYDWAMCWDDVHIGAAVMLAQITDKDVYKNAVEQHLDYWSTGTSSGERITYTPQGLAWLDSWGSLRYATTTAYIAAVYSEWEGCPSSKANTYFDFAVSQANYALGDTGFSYLIGFGEDYPQNPHHRTAQGSYSNNMNEPAGERHTLYGALVGGPDASDGYTDEVSNYTTNEVACDYNAGFTGLLAKLYSRYHGQTLKDFGAVEPVDEPELFAEAGINAQGDDFIEVKAYAYNETAWPARAPEKVELRYYIDLSEVYEAGGTANDIEITTNYMQDAATDGLKVWDEDNHIYYLSIVFDGNSFYPGGQEHYKKEVQVRLKSGVGVWDNSNDPSFDGLTTGSVIPGMKLAMYEDDTLVYGTEPKQGTNAGQSVGGSSLGNNTTSGNDSNNNANSNSSNGNNSNGNSGNSTDSISNGSAKNGDLSVKVEYSNTQGTANSISGSLYITNEGQTEIPLNELTIKYFFTNEGGGALSFSCYHAAMQGGNGSYSAVSGVQGTFDEYKADDADTVCEMTFSDNQKLSAGSTLTVNFCINHSDWSNFTLSNDYSSKKVENIVIYNKKVIFGNEPAS